MSKCFCSTLSKFLIATIQFRAIGVCCPKGLNGYKQLSIVSSPQRGDEVPLVRHANDLIPPAERGCGLATKSYSKIVGGRPTVPNEWPWMAAILRRSYNRVFCGGVLITNQHILTGIEIIFH